jgi:hypothetical protein
MERSAAEGVSMPVLSSLLAAAFGSGRVPRPGARRPLEAHLGIRDVEAVTPGWYHYDVHRHKLDLTAEGCTGDEIIALCHGHEWAGRAAFVVAVTVPGDGRPAQRSRRVHPLDAARLGQGFALAATALGLVAFQPAAFRHAALADRLGLHGVSRTPVHLMGVCLPSHHAGAHAVTDAQRGQTGGR